MNIFGKNYTRKEMNEKLKELVNSKQDISEASGAMCYSSVYIKPIIYTCETCNNKFEMDSYLYESVNDIKNIVKKIKKIGINVILDLSEFCEVCANNQGKKNIEKPECIFKIKFKEDEKYYESKSNITSDYKVLLAFIENKEVYDSGHGSTTATRREYKIIEKMTGLKYE